MDGGAVMEVVLSWIVPVIAASVFGFGIWATLEALRSVALGSAIGFVGFALAIGFDNPKMESRGDSHCLAEKGANTARMVALSVRRRARP